MAHIAREQKAILTETGAYDNRLFAHPDLESIGNSILSVRFTFRF